MEDAATKSPEIFDQAETPWPPQAIVTPADFRSVDYNSVVRGLKSVADSRLEAEFMNATLAHRENEPEFSVFRLLAAACGLHFRLHDKAGPFGAKIVGKNGRTPIPEDWLGEQTDHLFRILEEIEHPALRARLADIVWINDRKKSKAAAIAVMAYCECVEGLTSGTYEDRFATDNEVSLEEIDLIERASQIHARSNKRTAPMHERVSELLGSLYTKALSHVDVVPLGSIATLMSRYSLITMDQLATDMEAAAAAAEQKPGSYPLAIKELWDLAAFAYAQAKQPDDERRCQLAAVEQTLRMAPQTGSSSGAAHWHRQAIGELRQIPGTEERREELRKEMRVLQEKSLEEMRSFEVPLDLSDVVSGTIKVFEKLTLPEGLKQFALLARPSNAAQMRKQVMETQTGIAGLFASTHLDSDGKIIAEVEGASLDGSPPSEKWIKSKMIQQMQFTMDIAVRGQLEPSRRFLAGEFPLSERHFHFIVLQSPFVPRHHAATFALGFARLMQGDTLSAGPILIPQLEHCLRHVLINSSTDTSKMRNDLTQEDRSLSTLLDTYRDELVAIFGEDMILQIDLIFNHRPGPALRHEFAHGKVGDRSFAEPAIYYACCLIFLLVCAPLLSGWAQHVAPAIESGSF
ncbi:DUF4209 domain-containing protein [Nitratireductor aquimarinus]|uniref:DUF4209 domain-containing protein n=1 Tax=Nitratireductor TaxID=245876 RepID=UPI0019D36D87|nr:MULTISPECIES: DUF4209 domain-containing protein [Nitratireductor]MBN7778889.1 DUF4209 domain-containing protein [Nitratireductor pacificus]MBN7783226.1 DUF4209 domain-containing protein [Nitratireductor pacificus]MBN7792027.1 DUF4209 domain-containing protein [Nitratireductor aquimarinus]MBY6101241.1 DUF4209 domain-containing protein [Nitratireductor aquimarinus]MCA1262555.1 DUF4209 domain-containing protein [Nitratireductor aquimarinus]